MFQVLWASKAGVHVSHSSTKTTGYERRNVSSGVCSFCILHLRIPQLFAYSFASGYVSISSNPAVSVSLRLFSSSRLVALRCRV